MQRLQSAVQHCKSDPTVRVVLDINPNHFENQAYIDAVAPGALRSHDRIKELFRSAGIHYFAVDGVNDPIELSNAVEDYVSNNTMLGQRFVLMFDRTPSNLADLLGPMASSLAACYV